MAFRRYTSRFGRCLASDDDGGGDIRKLTKAEKRSKELFLIRNGAALLQEMITFNDGRGSKPIRMFSAKEVIQATANFAGASEILFGSFVDKIYKGKLGDRDICVSVIKDDSQNRDPSSVINEVAILSRINHPNVVKVVGCCLETAVPIIVYEELPGATLHCHLRRARPSSAGYISWQNRLKIVTQIAHALTYMHIGTTSPIIHRDIKPTNILLGECFAVKIFGFDISVSMPLGETKMECVNAAGTFGYLDPVYFRRKELSEKSDVYSYGMLLLDVLSGRMVAGVEPSLIEILLESADQEKEEHLISFLDSRIVEEAKKEQLVACLRLTSRCLAITWEERPEMKQVVEELWRIKGQ